MKAKKVMMGYFHRLAGLRREKKAKKVTRGCFHKLDVSHRAAMQATIRHKSGALHLVKTVMTGCCHRLDDSRQVEMKMSHSLRRSCCPDYRVSVMHYRNLFSVVDWWLRGDARNHTRFHCW